jgi:hypothetical protein
MTQSRKSPSGRFEVRPGRFVRATLTSSRAFQAAGMAIGKCHRRAGSCRWAFSQQNPACASLMPAAAHGRAIVA